MKVVLLIFINLFIVSNIEAQDPSKSIVYIESALGQGSGFFVDRNLVATNFHVLEPLNENFNLNTIVIYCEATDQYFQVDSIFSWWYQEDYASNIEADLIVLRTREHNKEFLKFSKNDVKKNLRVVSYGHPSGRSVTKTFGEIRSVMSNPKSGSDVSFAHSCPISPGSSGGPVLNEFNEVVGVNTLIDIIDRDVSFAQDFSTLKRLIENPSFTINVPRWWGEPTCQFNTHPRDFPFVRVTRNTSNNWFEEFALTPEDSTITVSLYYHNTSDSVVSKNTFLKLSLELVNDKIVFLGLLKSDNLENNELAGCAIIDLSSNSNISLSNLELVRVKWFPNQARSPVNLLDGQHGEEILVTGLFIGDIQAMHSEETNKFIYQGSAHAIFRILRR